MNGRASIRLNYNTKTPIELIFEDVNLSYRTEYHEALLTRFDRGEIEELYCIEGALIDLFGGNSSETVEIQGFVQNINGSYSACKVRFTPVYVTEI